MSDRNWRLGGRRRRTGIPTLTLGSEIVSLPRESPLRQCVRRSPKAQKTATGLLVAVSIAIAFATGCASDGEKSAKKKAPKRTILATEFDDIDVGDQAAESVAAQIGLYDDPALTDYVATVGRRMVQHATRRHFSYEFKIVDEAMPNAFALPGGHIYVSRGLLALVKDETELANVIGHEITHSAQRHSAEQEAMKRNLNPFKMPIVRMAKLAAFGRAQENSADRGGQQIAAAAGYDPTGLPSFLQRLGDLERLRFGSRMPSYLDTHPGTIERVSTTSVQAGLLTIGRGPPIEADAEGYGKRIEGIVVGASPASGVFRGTRFFHPGLGFQIRFPSGWTTENDHRAVGATSPDGNAVVFLSVEGPAQDPEAFAEKFIAARAERFHLKILRNSPIVIAGIDSWRVAASGSVAGRSLTGQITFVPFDGLMYRITAVAPSRKAEDFVAQARTTVHSFRRLRGEARTGFEIMRLRFTKAQYDESIPDLMQRTKSALRPGGIAVINSVAVNHRFKGGEIVKYVAKEVYDPAL